MKMYFVYKEIYSIMYLPQSLSLVQTLLYK